jgi:hypothetical protein
MHGTRFFLPLFFLAMFPHSLLFAADDAGHKQTGKAIEQADLAARKTLIRNNLPLTESEAQAFWPLYEAYEKQIAKLGERRSLFMGSLGENFEDMTDEKAMKLIHETLEQQQDRIKLTTRYFDQLAQVLPGNKLIRYYQIEYQIRAIIDAKISQSIPLIN